MKRKRRDANVTEETLPVAVFSGENASAPTITGAPEPPSKPIELPSTADLERELEREQGRTRMRRIVRGTFFVLIAVAAVAVLVATLFLPVLVVHGSSMTPTLHDGEMVVSVRSSAYQQGDVIAFYYNNSILVKRVIATSGQWVDIDEDGVVRVDGQVLDEPTLTSLRSARAISTCPTRCPKDASSSWETIAPRPSTAVHQRSAVSMRTTWWATSYSDSGRSITSASCSG